MVLCVIHTLENSQNILLSAKELSVRFNKRNGVMACSKNNITQNISLEQIYSQIDRLKIKTDYVEVEKNPILDLLPICEQNEVSFLLLQLVNSKSKEIQHLLNACRQLRIPYLLYNSSNEFVKFKKILLPVSFLVEELEKAQFAAAFGRFFGAEISLLLAKDYGSKALDNSQKIKSVLDKFNLKVNTIKGQKDSFKINQESLRIAKREQFDLLIVSASREYGLDDLIFGSMEQKLINKSTIPVLLINPRDDLYVLCD